MTASSDSAQPRPHAAFGLALVAAAIGSLVLSRWHRGRAVTALSVLGALAITGAAFNGASFLNYNESFSSMIMAGLWALALGCYLTSMFLIARALDAPTRIRRRI